jgi:hypothetical protein
MNAAPIFIVGCPRSGTTLMRRILNRHPCIAIGKETHFRRLVYLRRKAFGELSDLSNRRRLIAEYLASRHMKKSQLDTPEFAEKLLREATSYKAMFTSMLSHYAELQGKPRYGEKTPHHALFLDTLCDWFPEAVIVHMVRDPRASVASMQQRQWRGSVVANARTWLKLNQTARRFRDRPGYLEVRYEALVTDPVAEVRRICSLIGEEYSPSMLVPEAHPTDGSHNTIRSQMAVSPIRVDAWRKELSMGQVAQIEWVLGAGLECFGYAREASPASALTVLRGLSYEAFDLARTVIGRLPAVWYRFGAQTKIAKFESWASPRIEREGRRAPWEGR